MKIIFKDYINFMNLRNKIIKWLRLYTWDDLQTAYAKGHTNGQFASKIVRKHSQQEEQQDNGMSGEISSTTTLPGVQRLAYTSQLGIINTEFHYTQNKRGKVSIHTIYLDMGENKKKIRFRKQSKLNPRPSRGQRDTTRRQHDDNTKT